MRICMVVNSLQEFGGLEEIMTTLAVGLQQRGHQTSVLSAVWAPPDNQYVRRLRENDVPFVQLPKWLSYPASDWPTKEKILAMVMWLSRPLVYLLAGALFLLRRCSWGQSLSSARGWLRGQLMSRFVGPNRRRTLACPLLSWWRFRWHPDLLHIHGYTTHLLFAVDWAHARRMPVVYEEHQTPDSQFDWWQHEFQQSVNKAAMVVAACERSAQALRAVAGVTQPIVVVSPIVADPIASGWQEDAKPRQCDEHLLVTTIARLYVTKGLTYLLEAIAQVKATHPATQFRVCGDGPLRRELLAYADQLGSDGDQIFVGSFTREELPRIMAQTDIFVMPSLLEGVALAVVEAMAYGRAIVATSAGGIPNVIEDGVNGLLCRPMDSQCLAQKIRALIEDPALRTKLGRAARKSYEQGPFQPASVCDRQISIYQEVLRQERLRSAS